MLYQLGALDAFAQVAGTEVAYVKPHGALYHATVRDAAQAEAVVAAAADYDASLAVLGAPDSELLRAAEAAGLEPVPEAFADRAYLRDGRLVSRAQPDALIVEPAEVAARAVRLAVDHEVVSVDGSVVAVDARVTVRPRRHARLRSSWHVLSATRSRPPASRSSPSREARLLPYGPAAWLLEVDVGDDVLAAAAAVARSEAVNEVVPGARTVLVHLAPGADREEIGRQLLQLASAAEGAVVDDPSDAVELAVTYDGEDLDAVAEACGLTISRGHLPPQRARPIAPRSAASLRVSPT